jgi:signal transduction histidine kinase
MLAITALAKNAMEAMAEIPPESRQVVVRAAIDEEGKGIEIRVEDAGPGLGPGDLDRVFTPYYTTKPKSLGLGLSLCRWILARHGGRIEALSDPAGGGMFRFTLPFAKEGAASEF